jgi:predicted NAD/FAD-binding protein
MKIAVIGGGISGILAARLLAARHDVHLFEANSYLGGHTNTVGIEAFGSEFRVDTGFMVLNSRNYPSFTRLLRTLGIETQNSDMSFSVRCDRTGLEYQGSSLNGLFAQRRNLLRFGFHRMLLEILRFNRRARETLNEEDNTLGLGQFLQSGRFGGRFADHYLIPMCAAIWSARPDRVLEMPARFILRFLDNHGLLQLGDRPQWQTIPGGAQRYVTALTAPIRDRIFTGAPVCRVERRDDHVAVIVAGKEPRTYDKAVIAAHGDQALAMLADASPLEHEILGAFSFQRNEAVLHTDASQLPRSRRAWASWNYRIPADEKKPVYVTYDVNRLQNLGAPRPICVTLNGGDDIAADQVLRRLEFHHPVFDLAAVNAQRCRRQINGPRRTYFCGAYWRNGFHEDGVNSALAVAKDFGLGLDDLPSCKVAFTAEPCAISAEVR